MPFKLTLEEKPAYLHALVTGENNKENIVGYLEELITECAARGRKKVLIEKRLEGPRLAIADIFEIISEKSRLTLGMMRAIAYVDVYATDEILRFAETVAVNRALPMKVFRTVGEAEAWISGTSPQGHGRPTDS